MNAKAAQENFPVASRLLPKKLRAGMMAFYAFARGADDIADDPDMLPESKRRALATLEEALINGRQGYLPDWAVAFYALAQNDAMLKTNARDLLCAFRQDTVKTRYRNWDELLDYCKHSAAPVGRIVLLLAGETKANIQAADALCNCLQILNHVQDCARDFTFLDRVYLPMDWMEPLELSPESLHASRSSPAMRKLFDRMLKACADMLKQAEGLPATIGDRRLRMEVGLIYELACALREKLLREDPLKRHVKLSWHEKLRCLFRCLRYGL